MYPVLFEVGNFFISSLWVLAGLGFLIWGIVLIKLTEGKSMKMAFLVNTFFKMLIWGAIGGRVIYLLVNISDVIADPKAMIPLRLVSIWDHGFNFWGIVAGIFIYTYYAAKQEEENIQRWFDILTMAFLTAIPFGHMGALFEGTNYGNETNLPWGITFDSYTVPFTVPIHPTQVYALIYTLIILVTMGVLSLKKQLKQDGDLTLIVAIAYSSCRFAEEFFRGDEAITFLKLNLANWVSLAVLLFAGISLFIRYNKHVISKYLPKKS